MSISKCEYLYFFIFLVGYCETLSETYLYREVLIMRGRYKTSNISFAEQTRSKIQCGIQCTSVCQSFSYHKATSTCRGYDVIISDAMSSVLEGGWKTYNIDRTGSPPETSPYSSTVSTTTTTVPSTTTTTPRTTTLTTAPPITTTEPQTTEITTALSTVETTTTAPPTTTATTAAPSCLACPSDYICKLSILFCYKYYPTRKYRENSELDCSNDGGMLAIIDNVDKDNEILNYISTESISETFYWVQGKYLNNEWRYDDGSLMTYFRWAPNHPFKNDLIAFNSGNGFHGTENTYQDVFFCEIRL
eukprot:XP_011432395.1 PREDICTED: uncharacterized protein LOC105331769 [Crassostrea gigas]